MKHVPSSAGPPGQLLRGRGSCFKDSKGEVSRSAKLRLRRAGHRQGPFCALLLHPVLRVVCSRLARPEVSNTIPHAEDLKIVQARPCKFHRILDAQRLFSLETTEPVAAIHVRDTTPLVLCNRMTCPPARAYGSNIGSGHHAEHGVQPVTIAERTSR
jgi:hypothetical protein